MPLPSALEHPPPRPPTRFNGSTCRPVWAVTKQSQIPSRGMHDHQSMHSSHASAGKHLIHGLGASLPCAHTARTLRATF